MRYDILKKVKSVLVADATIHTYVADDIRVRDLPLPKIPKQITIRKTFGTSNSIIPACDCTVYITVWVKQKEVTEPYKMTTQITERINDLFNRKGESLNESDLIVNQMKRTDAEISYTDDQEYWTSTIILECVTND